MTQAGKIYLLVLGIVIAAFLSLAAGAQVITQKSGAQRSRESQGSILVDVERVLVDVTVTQADGTLVTDLQKGSFHLFEDGVEQEILSFSSEDVPVSIGIIFDTSGSMSDKFDGSRQAVLQFVKTSNPGDEFFLVNFSDRAELASPFTSDLEDLQKRIMSGEPKGSTALLDAIYLGLSQMKGAHNNKHALLVVSDGGDNHSRYSKTEIRNALKEADCWLYAIGFFRLKDILLTLEELHGPGLLSELAELTGGHMFPVSNLDDLPEIGAKIGTELRSRYVLGYKPNNARHDGSWRRIKVKVTPPTNPVSLNVYARTGYFSPRY